jgi:hypothetical protein
METSQADTPPSWQKQNHKMAESRLLNDLEDRLEEFKGEVTERPFLYLAIAFVAGFASWTFPVRLIFSVLTRLVSFLFGPAILLMGILKIKELLGENLFDGGTQCR